MALIPQDKVTDVFCTLSEYMDTMLKDKYNNIDKFADYVTENYIETDTFPIEIWNHYDSDKRTNNDLEGYNSKLSKFLKKHPNIWIFIKKIREEESNSALSYIRILNGTFQKRGRNCVDTSRDLEILKQKCDLLSHKIDINSYLKNVANTLHSFKKPMKYLED